MLPILHDALPKKPMRVEMRVESRANVRGFRTRIGFLVLA